MRMMMLQLASVAVVASAASCEGGSNAPLPDAAVDKTVHYSVAINSREGVTVKVDGVPLGPDSNGIDVEYPDYASALAAPLFHVETWINDDLVDAIDIGIGACEEQCASSQLEACAGQPVTEERVSASYDESGFFEGGAQDPRGWRWIGCVRCTFLDGFDFVVCT